MSTTEIYAFNRKGEAYFYGEASKAWRGQFTVLSLMEERHLPLYLPPYVTLSPWYREGMTDAEIIKRNGHRPTRLMPWVSGDPEAANAIFALAYNEKVPEHERIALLTTLDNALARKEDIPKIVRAFRLFGGETNLPEQADILERMEAEADVIAVAWNQTSVNADTWDAIGDYDPETGETASYNCLTGKRHFWIFDELARGETI